MFYDIENFSPSPSFSSYRFYKNVRDIIVPRDESDNDFNDTFQKRARRERKFEALFVNSNLD